jgi:hypothetical protein
MGCTVNVISVMVCRIFSYGVQDIQVWCAGYSVMVCRIFSYGVQDIRVLNPLMPELNPSAQRCLRDF